MARSREEIISEMVDSGLFTDDEIRQAAGSEQQLKPSLARRGYEALAVPEKMSRRGLGLLASAVPSPAPTGNRMLDVARGTPRVVAESIAETAPSFISPGAIATSGALRLARAAAPAAKALGRGVANAAESVSGLEYKTPGVLKEAASDASLLFGKGRKAAGTLYERLIDEGKIRKSFARATDSKSLVDEALSAADDGTLTVEEALVARQTLDAAKKTFPKFSYQKMRNIFDTVVKEKFALADKEFSRAVKSEALRLFLPQNKLGGTSIAKSTLGTIAGAVPLAFMSPVAQGTVATGVGLGSRLLGKVAGKTTRSAIGSGTLTTAAGKAFLDLINKRKKKNQ